MSWKIKFTYDTGDTFNSEPGQTDYLETTMSEAPYAYVYEWSDITDAQAALERMREHYLWQDSLSTTYGEDLNQPEWWTGKFDPKYRYRGDYPSFNAIGNNGEEIRLYGGSYLGYFETLVSAEIVSAVPEDDKNSFNLRGY